SSRAAGQQAARLLSVRLAARGRGREAAGAARQRPGALDSFLEAKRAHRSPLTSVFTLGGAVGAVAGAAGRGRRPSAGGGGGGQKRSRCSAVAVEEAGSAVAVESSLGPDGRFQGPFVPAPDPPYLGDRLKVWERLAEKKRAESDARPKEPIKIELPDGSVREGLSWATTPMEIAESISKRLAADSVVALVEYSDPSLAVAFADVDQDVDDSDDEEEAVSAQLWDLSRPLEGDCRLELVKFDDPRGQSVFWHSSSHVMGSALEREFGGHLTCGPDVDGGYYYDVFLGDERLSEADYERIEKRMQTVRQEDAPFERLVLTKAEALELFAGNPFKVDLIRRKITDDTLTTAYRCGPLIDLCRGPHVPSTGRIKAFQVTKTSSSYYCASAEKDSLQRVYGVSFPSDKQLKQHMRRLEEAKERDHRLIGKKQELFFFDAVTSPGSCFWTSYGARLYNRLQELMRVEYRSRGFEEVITPNIYSADLFKRSGHYQNYRDDMYGFKVEGQEWFLKPMNCPGHCIMFGSRPRSYRELPIRLASFGVLHRNELSGTLSGLTRVRRFQQDDAHIFCTEGQIKSEVAAALDFVFDIYELFGFEFTLALSTRPKKALGALEMWERAEEQLRQALEETGKPWSLKKGDGAFYGPKIDIQLKDALGRGHQCGTVQLDFQLPLRFNLRFQSERGEAAAEPEAEAAKEAAKEGEAGAEALPLGYERPVILHRSNNENRKSGTSLYSRNIQTYFEHRGRSFRHVLDHFFVHVSFFFKIRLQDFTLRGTR
ncbi:unnamed protein product, partial [Prorocentrum cordatum]